MHNPDDVASLKLELESIPTMTTILSIECTCCKNQ
jgi:hypothetical protein